MTIDIINGTLEFGGAIVIGISVWQLYQKKYAAGVSPYQFGFFSVWGIWNIFYYPQLDQWWSMAGGIAVVSMNTLWLVLYIYYDRKMKKLAKQKLAVSLDELNRSHTGTRMDVADDGHRYENIERLDVKRKTAPVCFECGGRGCHPAEGGIVLKCKRCEGTGHE